MVNQSRSVIVLILLAFMLLPARAGGVQAASAGSRASDVQKYAYELAVIQTGYVSKSDPLVGRFARPLASLAWKCYKNKVSNIADYTVTSHNILAQHGLRESYLSVLSHVNSAVPAHQQLPKCAEVFALYVSLRIGH